MKRLLFFALLALAGAAARAQVAPPSGAAVPPGGPARVPRPQVALIEKPAPAHVPVDTAAARRLLGQPGAVLLDVRTPEEFAAGHLPGARNVDFRAPDFAQQVAKLDKTKPYVLYCASGNRSGQAAALMQRQGFRRVANGGGYSELKIKPKR